MRLWTGCVAGALLEGDYREQLEEAGFEAVDIEPAHVYDHSEIARMVADVANAVEVPDIIDLEASTAQLEGAAMSSFVRARKPARQVIT
jgi:hypothetical protein